MAGDGELLVVATPIGNLADLSPRGAEALERADLIAAEDTRRTRKLLSHLGLSKPLLRCDEAAEEKASDRVLKNLREGRTVALVCDAGVPAISDPGARLVQMARNDGYRVTPIPGPSSITAALSAAGMVTIPFRFLGFLARKGGDRKRQLEVIARSDDASVFFESPHRLARTLGELAKLEPTRPACVAREMTKLHEEFRSGTLGELAEVFGRQSIRGGGDHRHRVGIYSKRDSPTSPRTIYDGKAMNPAIARILALAFFVAVGTYQLVRGIVNIRSRRESSIWGWLRVVFGSLLLLIPLPLYFFILRSGTPE